MSDLFEVVITYAHALSRDTHTFYVADEGTGIFLMHTLMLEPCIVRISMYEKSGATALHTLRRP